MGTKTKYYSSLMSGAPALSNTAGSLIAILDAVLVNGFGSQNVQSLVVASGVATVTWATAHPYVTDAVMLVAGATPAGLNGEKRVTVTSANSVTFPAVGVSDGAATGTITSKAASAGWTKLYTGTNLAAYKSLAPESTGCVLRVDDTGTTVARVRGYESMSDINTGTGPFPTVTQIAAPGLYWGKASANPRPWRIVADDRGIYWMPSPSTSHEHQVMYFGDPVAIRSNDPYVCILRAQTGDRTTSSGSPIQDDLSISDTTSTRTTANGCYVARAAHALGSAALAQSCMAGPLPISAGSSMSGASFMPPFPSPVDNGLHVAPIALVQDNTIGLRGWFPGIYGMLQNAASLVTDDTIDGEGTMAGKRLRVVKCQIIASAGAMLFDTLDDWR